MVEKEEDKKAKDDDDDVDDDEDALLGILVLLVVVVVIVAFRIFFVDSSNDGIEKSTVVDFVVPCTCTCRNSISIITIMDLINSEEV